jgi:hypothetical protein
MRFYRQAQVADDIFDALRSLWLATENLLDSLTPWQRREKEGEWLKRALKGASNHVDLSRYLPPTTKFPHNAAHDYFYDELRTHLFHAKASRNPALPAEADSITHLVERHERLTRLYLDLLQATVGVRRDIGGGLTYAGFDLAFGNLDTNSTLQVTDDASPVRVDDTAVNPAGGEVVSAPLTRSSKLSRPGRRVLVAEIAGEQVARLEAVRRLSVLNDATLIASEMIDGRLELADIEILRGQYTIRLHNIQQPKSFVTF